MMFGNYSKFLNLIKNFDPNSVKPTSTRISRCKKALEHICYNSNGWLLLNKTSGCLIIELFRRWSLSIVRYVEAQGIGDHLNEKYNYYTMMKNKIETGIARGIGVGLL
jgi:hypothetical protein